MADDFPSSEFGASEREVVLYIDQALAFSIVGTAYNNAKIEGSLCVPEAFLVTYALPELEYDPLRREWFTELPQPPLSLPLGYSVDEVYFANAIDGKGLNLFWIKAKRRAYRDNMPKPFGVSAWIEGSTLRLQANDGTSLLDQPVYVRMASSRTDDLNTPMAVADDVLEAIFNNVVGKLKDRMGIPKDIIKDDIPAGNKTS